MEMHLSGRFRFRLLFLLTFLIATIWLYRYHAFNNEKSIFEDEIALLSKNSLDIGGYQDAVAAAFFTAIDNSSHKNCRLFRQRFPIKSERDGIMDIAFTITVKSDIRPIARLLRMIYRVNNYYCIHVDKNADSAFTNSLEGLAACFGKNIEIVPRKLRVEMIDGEESYLKVQLLCAQQALVRHLGWRYLINIGDEDFPLRTNKELIAALTALNGSNIIDAISINPHEARIKNQILPLNVCRF